MNTPDPAPTPRTRTIEIGALCLPLSKQLEGLISPQEADRLDRDNEAITRCNLMGYMPDSVTAKARKRLMEKCQKAVNAHRKTSK